MCRVDVSPDMTAVFPNMGIQCVRKRDSADSLNRRQEIKVGPFKQEFAHATTSNNNLNSIRLCLQVFLTGVQGGGTAYSCFIYILDNSNSSSFTF